MKNFHQLIDEGSLHKWFKGSKSKDGKGGWVNVVTGGTCASDEPGEGTPKCVSSAKRASMSKSERLSAARRKKKADPNQQSKSGAAKPTYVSTDKPKKKMKEETQISETKDKKGKGSGSKDACYHKVKSRYSVWPSAYASGALVKCRKVGAANWGNSSKKEEFEGRKSFSDFQAECWKTHKKVGMKMKGGKLVPDCRPKNEETLPEAKVDKGRSDYGKASIRNYRRMGPGHGDPGMFDPEGKRGKTIEKRREEHKARRGVKGAKVPAYKREETETHVYWSSEALDQLEKIQEKSAAWQRKEGKNKTGGLNEKGRKSYERENPGSDLKRPQPEGGPRKRSFCARMSGVKGPMKDEKGRPTRKALALRKWKC